MRLASALVFDSFNRQFASTNTQQTYVSYTKEKQRGRSQFRAAYVLVVMIIKWDMEYSCRTFYCWPFKWACMSDHSSECVNAFFHIHILVSSFFIAFKRLQSFKLWKCQFYDTINWAKNSKKHVFVENFWIENVFCYDL